ncbi:MAG: hypothetical protein KAJ29_00670 [Alphaproteobacteria bacterium]|nr:hypothetical protein [Alphaproteobacteria bacterium]
MPAGSLACTKNSENHNEINALQEINTEEAISRMRKAGSPRFARDDERRKRREIKPERRLNRRNILL